MATTLTNTPHHASEPRNTPETIARAPVPARPAVAPSVPKIARKEMIVAGLARVSRKADAKEPRRPARPAAAAELDFVNMFLAPR